MGEERRWILTHRQAPGALPPVTLFFTFVKIGSVLFGSGYVLLAFPRGDSVVGVLARGL